MGDYMDEGKCKFCESVAKCYITCDNARVGVCDGHKDDIIKDMAERIINNAMTPEQVHEEGVWIYTRSGPVPFPCNFPPKWKDEALNLAEKLKNLKTN